MQAYCFKCRAKKEMKDAKSITMKNGKPATQGVCPSCGTKMFRIGNSQTNLKLADRILRGWMFPVSGCPALFLVSNHTFQAYVTQQFTRLFTLERTFACLISCNSECLSGKSLQVLCPNLKGVEPAESNKLTEQGSSKSLQILFTKILPSCG